jgi:hypothetical protein
MNHDNHGGRTGPLRRIGWRLLINRGYHTIRWSSARTGGKKARGHQRLRPRPRYDPEDVRVALDLDPYVPALTCDARERESVKEVLITLVEHVLTSESAAGSTPLSDPGEADDPGAISSAR